MGWNRSWTVLYASRNEYNSGHRQSGSWVLDQYQRPLCDLSYRRQYSLVQLAIHMFVETCLSVKIEVLTAVTMRITVFWGVMPCSLVDI
jgi:hypothetical protein